MKRHWRALLIGVVAYLIVGTGVAFALHDYVPLPFIMLINYGVAAMCIGPGLAMLPPRGVR